MPWATMAGHAIVVPLPCVFQSNLAAKSLTDVLLHVDGHLREPHGFNLQFEVNGQRFQNGQISTLQREFPSGTVQAGF